MSAIQAVLITYPAAQDLLLKILHHAKLQCGLMLVQADLL